MSLEIILPDTNIDKNTNNVNTIMKFEWYNYTYRTGGNGIGMVVHIVDDSYVLITIDSYGNVDAFDAGADWVINGFKFADKPLPNGTKISFVIGAE